MWGPFQYLEHTTNATSTFEQQTAVGYSVCQTSSNSSWTQKHLNTFLQWTARLKNDWDAATARHPPISVQCHLKWTQCLPSSQTYNSRHSSELHKRRVSSITIRLGRQSHRDRGSVTESCQNRRERGSERHRRRENKQKIRKGGNGLSTPIYEQCTESSMFGLLMTCTDREGVGRCSSNTTCHISQPRQLHNRERFTLIMKSFAC